MLPGRDGGVNAHQLVDAHNYLIEIETFNRTGNFAQISHVNFPNRTVTFNGMIVSLKIPTQISYFEFRCYDLRYLTPKRRQKDQVFHIRLKCYQNPIRPYTPKLKVT